MDVFEFEEVQKTEWVLTDDDCCQVRRTDAMSVSGIYELAQINQYPGHFREPPHQDEDYFRVSHAVIDISEYSEEEIQSMLASYGYDSLDDFVEKTSPDWNVIYKEDGTIDRENSPSYTIDFGLIAEMFFETESLEYALCTEYDTWNEAVAAIEEITGCNLGHVKEAEKTGLDQRIRDAVSRASAEVHNPPVPGKERD